MPFQFVSSASFNRRSTRLVLISLSVLVVIVVMAFSARAWRMKTTGIANPAGDAHLSIATPSQSQPTSPARSHLNGRLALQPEADKLRRNLGQRFLTAGREVSVLAGTVNLGTERYTVRITRSQDEDDERLTVVLNGLQVLTWSGLNGARLGDTQATGNLRSLIERLALDSPDQFILAQVRGNSYFNVAANVRPSEAGSSDNYAGPVWNLVRVGEPLNLIQNRPQSLWRLYYLNTSTGLIDKIVSQEQGETVTAEVAGWINQGGETVPTLITWKRRGQTVMDLSLNNVTYGPRQ